MNFKKANDYIKCFFIDRSICLFHIEVIQIKMQGNGKIYAFFKKTKKTISFY
jgi:hypothetical protein